jgi:starch-binding outer membrane protein, SusD/RagB family
MTMLRILAIVACFTFFTACKKFLEEKPDKKLAVPSTLKDLQALLDDNVKMNQTSPSYGESSADDYYLADNDFNGLFRLGDKNTYLWSGEMIFDRVPNGWYDAYFVVNTTNVVLENLEKIERNRENETAWKNVKGSARFFRAKAFFEIAEIWAPAYDSAGSALGIPLRVKADFNIPSVRSTLQQTYEQILSDLKEAEQLLPPYPQHVMRPSRTAAQALLARVCLSMRQYAPAKQYANLALQATNELLDFNSLNASAGNPFTRFSKEVIFHSLISPAANLTASRAKIDSLLYNSYAANDLRGKLFFKNNNNGSYAFKGSYDGSSNLFNGLTTGELYLVRAECLAREGDAGGAMNDLNTLLRNRWKTGTFVPFQAATAAEALEIILSERRKELVMRGLRWSDLKRRNKEGAGIIIKRFINGQWYQLGDDGKHYALPIPGYIIELTGMPQNPR